MDKLAVVHPDNKILLSVKKKWDTEPRKLRRKYKWTLLSKWSQTVKASYCRTPTAWHLGKAEHRHGKESRGCQRLGLKRDRKQGTQRILNAICLFCICEHVSVYICQKRCTTPEHWVNLMQNLGDYYLSSQLHNWNKYVTLLEREDDTPNA